MTAVEFDEQEMNNRIERINEVERLKWANFKQSKKMEKMTHTAVEYAVEKQLKYIESIEDNTGIIFTGKTKKEASQYIDANKNHPSNQNEWAITNGY